MTTEERLEKLERELSNTMSLHLVDAEGRIRAAMFVTKNGSGLLLFDGNDIMPYAMLFVTKDGPVPSLFGERDKARALLTVPVDKMYLNLYNAVPDLQYHVSINDVPPIVELRDAGSKMQAVLSVNAANLEFMLHDAEGNMRASLTMGTEGGRLRLFDEKGNTIWQAP
jgi:hypothetical protein